MKLVLIILASLGSAHAEEYNTDIMHNDGSSAHQVEVRSISLPTYGEESAKPAEPVAAPTAWQSFDMNSSSQSSFKPAPEVSSQPGHHKPSGGAAPPVAKKTAAPAARPSANHYDGYTAEEYAEQVAKQSPAYQAAASQISNTRGPAAVQAGAAASGSAYQRAQQEQAQRNADIQRQATDDAAAAHAREGNRGTVQNVLQGVRANMNNR